VVRLFAKLVTDILHAERPSVVKVAVVQSEYMICYLSSRYMCLSVKMKVALLFSRTVKLTH